MRSLVFLGKLVRRKVFLSEISFLVFVDILHLFTLFLFLWCYLTYFMINRNYTPNSASLRCHSTYFLCALQGDQYARHGTMNATGINAVSFILVSSSCWCSSIIHVMACFSFTHFLSFKCSVNGVLC